MWGWIVGGAVLLALILGITLGATLDCDSDNASSSSSSSSSGSGCSNDKADTHGPDDSSSGGCGSGTPSTTGADGYGFDDDDPTDSTDATDGLADGTDGLDGLDGLDGADLGDGTDIDPTVFAVTSTDLLDFGEVALGETRTLTVRLRNVGQVQYQVSSIQKDVPDSVTPAPDGWVPMDDVTIENAEGAFPRRTAPGGSKAFVVSFAPTRRFAGSGLGALRFVTSAGEVTLEVQGSVAVPKAVITPTYLSVAGVRVGQPVTRTITVRNTGTAPLELLTVTITKPGAGHLAVASPGQTILAPQDFVEILVSLSTGEAAIGASLDAELEITTNDLDNPVLVFSIYAFAWSDLQCVLELGDAPFDFGFVLSHELSDPRGVTVTNVGTAPCQGIEVEGTLGPPIEAGSGPEIGDCPKSGEFEGNWLELADPAVALTKLDPGDSATVAVRLRAPGASGVWTVPGRTAIRSSDLGSPIGNGNFLIVKGEPSSACNFVADFGTTDLVISDPVFAAGTVPKGCKSAPVTVFGDVSLCSATLAGCPEELSVRASVPEAISEACETPLPTPGVRFHLEATPDLGVSQPLTSDCVMLLDSTEPYAPLRVVPITGTFSASTQASESFALGAVGPTSLLVLADAGPASATLRTTVAAALGGLLDALPDTLVLRVGVAGSSADGHLLADEAGVRFLTGAAGSLLAPDAWVTERLEDLGVETPPSLLDRLLGTIGPIGDFDTAPSKPEYACAAETCVDALECLGSADLQTTWCRGSNVGFVSESRVIHVLVVSARDDAGSASLVESLDALMRSSGFEGKHLIVHAIAGPPEGCPEGDGIAPAPRLLDLTHATGGRFISACGPAIASKLYDLGATAFVEPWVHRLAYPPDPTTVAVTSDAGACEFVYEPASRSVDVEKTGLCANAGLATVTYDAVCAP